jgi:hypothetical protein
MACSRGCCESQAEHYRSVQTAKGDLSPEVADINRREKQLVKDREAYKRLRKDGLQPHQLSDSAKIEASGVEQIDIDMKIQIPASDRDRVKDIIAENAMSTFSGQTR